MNAILKVKLCSLGLEAKVIRRVQRQLLKVAARKRAKELGDSGWGAVAAVDSMQSHKKNVVSMECRATQLAYGFLRGRHHEVIENIAYTYPDWAAVERMVMKYGTDDPRVLNQQFEEWKTGAQKRIDYFASSAYIQDKFEAKSEGLYDLRSVVA